MKFDTLFNMLGQFLKITAAPMGQDNLFNTHPPGGNDLFFNSAHGQNIAGKGQFPGHGQRPLDLTTRRHGDNGGGNGNAGTGSILGRGPFGHMNMDKGLIKIVIFNTVTL